MSAPAAFAVFAFVVLPVCLGIAEVHKGRADVGTTPAGYTDVRFDATDGVHLAGWYRPSRNGAAVVLAHGGGSTRRGALRHAGMFARHGYGVLLYDTRGAGESDGTHNSWGWEWERDVAGALRYVRSRDDVDPDRIAGLGLSSGGDALLAAAGDGSGFAAVVTDGAVARNYEDVRHLRGSDLGAKVMFATVGLITGMEPGVALEDAARRVDAPLLLVSAGRADERDAGRLYERAAPDAEHWNLPASTHTAGIRTDRAEYERRVVGFVDDHTEGAWPRP